MTMDLRSRCSLLRSLHKPGTPLLLPNVWDAATARAVVSAAFPVVATTSWGVRRGANWVDGDYGVNHLAMRLEGGHAALDLALHRVAPDVAGAIGVPQDDRLGPVLEDQPIADGPVMVGQGALHQDLGEDFLRPDVVNEALFSRDHQR